MAVCALGPGALAQAVPDPVRRAEPPPAAAAQAVTPPSLAGDAALPDYPAGAQGPARVVLELTIDEAGAAKDAKVISPPQAPFDEAALASLARLKFSPARLGDQPIPVRIQYAINFQPPAAAQRPLAPSEQPVNLKGQVRERGSRRRLTGVEVTVPAAGLSSFTDAKGQFELRGVPAGAQEVVIAAPGFERLAVKEVIEEGKALEVRYLLQPLFASPFEATITGEKERQELSKTSISIQEVNRIPGTQGDALKVVENLPGVARTSPIGGGLLVIRGSKPGDSLAFLDGLNIPLLFHFGALSATVNPDLLEGIDFIPGNFSVAYGDMTGGLVEVKSRSLREEPHGYANFSLLEASALVEGAVPGVPGLRVAAAGRRSYIDLVLQAAFQGTDVGLVAAPRYYDAQLRLDYVPPGSDHKLQLIALTSNDALGVLFKRPLSGDPNVSGDLELETGFSQVRLKHAWRRGDVAVDSVAMYEHIDLRFGFATSRFRLIGNDLYLRSIGSWELSPRLALSAGFEAINRHVVVSARFPNTALQREGDPGQGGPRPDDPYITLPPSVFDRYSPGLFAEARWRPLPGLTVTPGVRFDSFVYTDQPAKTRSLTPRLTVRWDASEQLALKAGVGTYSQGARNGDASKAFGSPAILPERALQLTAGAELKPVAGVFVSAEAFYKKLSDLIVRPGTDTSSTQLVNRGEGWVYGLEVLARKELTDRLFGWVAYTLSRSDRVDRPGEPQRLFDFDQTHNLTVIASYQLPRGWQVGARLRLISGSPDTPVLGAKYLAGSDSYLPLYGAVNSERLPLFHQLDLRIDKVWTFDAWSLDLYLDVLNLYNHRSIEGVQYSYDFSQSSFIGGLPIFPSIGLKGSF